MDKKPQILWTEDDCTRGTKGHEGLAHAWQRLFGVPYNSVKKIRTIDHGDCLEHQFPGNVSVWNIHGASYEITKS